MDYNALNSKNNYDFEYTERDVTIEVLSYNDVDDHVSYNNEIIRTDNTSLNFITLSQLFPLYTP